MASHSPCRKHTKAIEKELCDSLAMCTMSTGARLECGQVEVLGHLSAIPEVQPLEKLAVFSLHKLEIVHVLCIVLGSKHLSALYQVLNT